MIHTHEISGMHCQNCVTKIESALKSISSIKEVKVTLDPPQAIVEMERHVEVGELNRTLKNVGNYSVKEESTITSQPKSDVSVMPSSEPQSLSPLFIIIGYLIGGVLLRALLSSDYSVHSIMSNFMGGFFVLFSLFKMIDLSGFAEGYSTYDVIAKHSRGYALAYPFIELTLGVLYLSSFLPLATNILTIVLMAIGSIGVFQALREKRTIQCACLGTALKLPMTKVTLTEDVGMGVMAVLMLLV